MSIERYKLASGNILEVYQDSDIESPRMWDNLGTMLCFHNRYNLGDELEDDEKPDSFEGWDDLKDYLIRKCKGGVILPLYLMDHSGLSISTTPFSCRWDSGQVGFIYVTADDIRKEYDVKETEIPEDIIEKVTRCLEGEVETYDQYLSGDVYGFCIVKEEMCNLNHKHRSILDGCGGFYGSDIHTNGMLDHINDTLAETVES